jgi:hypothetical protein
MKLVMSGCYVGYWWVYGVSHILLGKLGQGSACCFLEGGHLEDCLIIYRVITKVEVTVTASYILSPPGYKIYFTLMDFPCHFVIDPWDTWWCSWLRLSATSREVTGSIPDVPLELLIYIILSAACDPGVDSASNINECQVYFLGVKATCA